MANAVVDTFSLASLLTVDWLNLNYPSTIYRGEHSHYMCKFFHFFGWVSSDSGVLLTTAMTLERGLAITFPLRSSSWCTTKRAKRVTVLVFIFVFLKDVNFLFTSDTYALNESDRLCYVYLDSENLKIFWKFVWPWIHNIFLLVSFTAIIISNIIIIRHIKISDRIRKDQHNCSMYKSRECLPESVKTKPGSRRRQVATMLLVDSFTVIVCTLPFSIFTTIDSNTVLLDASRSEKDWKRFISSMSFYLLYVNRCVNFYLYSWSGTRFREALLFVICGCKRKRKPLRVVTISYSKGNTCGVHTCHNLTQ
ncbi:uncharacterized protein LOC133205115 [Saccostrea echinata]|uniref:uncharacterized protein LOC133205115 n=1 Tax=Saccostrea echinata TaxID=191078 RepID=UPI002A807E97|nr:uncharacterized protein LOC133205115 [Saccostrea echinata]